jgi:serine/threonine-protein kinase
MVGKKVHHYQFLEKLGEGGMGAIYKAQDTRLNRFVAIKVLTAAATGSPERRRRFLQEAQAASALNHPNIITIHDILSEGDAGYMVMEYVQGKTLAELVPKGGMRVPQVLKLALQMTDALQVAHAARIVHRDLKPGNVMVTESGLVKILDFGLAKLSGPGPLTNTGPEDATKTIGNAPLTVEGSILGTVSYMSPEQAMGQKVDSRSDIFSFGLVLYEMVTGERAFQSDSALTTLSAILRDDPRPIHEIAPDVPAPLEEVIKKCVRKSPEDRYQNMRDVFLALSALKADSDSGVLYRADVTAMMKTPAGAAPAPAEAKKEASAGASAPAGPPASRRPAWTALAIAAGALVLIGGGGLAWWMNRPAPVPPPEPAAASQPAPAAPADPTLTNDSIIQLVAAKVPEDVILGQIRSAPVNFNLSASELIRLTQSGVSGTLIAAMRDPKAAPEPVRAAPKSAPQAKTAEAARGVPKTAEKAPGSSGAALPPAPPAPEVSTPVSAPASAVAPVPAPSGPEAPAGAVATRQVSIPDGAPFKITLTADIPSDAAEGTPIRFTVTEDVKAGDTVVIAKGAQATGEIAQAARRRIIGSTKATLRLKSVETVDGATHAIRALSARSGKSDPVRSVEAGAKPRNDKIAALAGTEYIAYIDGGASVSVPR